MNYNQNNTNQNAKVALKKAKDLLDTTNSLLSKKADDDLKSKSQIKSNFFDEINSTIKSQDSKDSDIKIDLIRHNNKLKIKVNGEDYNLDQKTKMQIIKENLESFFILWGIVLFLNQVFLFGGCFHLICLIAALPHTGVIAFLAAIFFINDKKKNITPKTKKIEEKIIQALEEDYKRAVKKLK